MTPFRFTFKAACHPLKDLRRPNTAGLPPFKTTIHRESRSVYSQPLLHCILLNDRLPYDGSFLVPLARQRPSLLLEEKVPQAAAWGGCGVRYTVAMIETFRRKRTAVTPHQSRFARQLLLKEKPLVCIPLWWNHRAFVR